MKAVLLISHGSRLPETKQEVQDLIRRLKEKNPLHILEYAFLELESPSIPEGIELCVQKGAQEIIVLLNFLNSGRHVNQDIPAIIAQARKTYPSISIALSKPVGQHFRIVELFEDMITDHG